MPDGHKAAVAAGRVDTAAVSGYLEALEAQRPERGRQVTPGRLEARRAEIDAQLAALADEPDMSAVEQAFIEHAASGHGRTDALGPY